MCPSVGRDSDASILISVVFPAPFAPKTTTRSPSATVNDTSSTPTCAPNRFETPETETIDISLVVGRAS